MIEALDISGKLTIGDGLVSQIPSLLISVASGILVTRTANEKAFGDTIGRELFNVPQVLYIVSALMIIFAIIPGFPILPFLILGVALGIAGYLVNEGQKQVAEDTKIQQQLLNKVSQLLKKKNR